MRKKVGAKKVGGEKGREQRERVLGAWRVVAAKGQVPPEDEDGAAPPSGRSRRWERRRWKRGAALCVCIAGTVQDEQM